MDITKFALIVFFLTIISCSGDDKSDKQSTDMFTRSASPVYRSPFGLAADPSVIRVDDTLFLYYTAEGGIAVAISLDDGSTWNRPNNSQTDYLALSRQADQWDNTLETPEVIKVGDKYKMYYSGYREGESDNPHVESYEIGLAVSQNGIDFTRIPQSRDQPILKRDLSDESTFDRHALTSPGVVYDNDRYHMIYAGWNVTDDWTGINAGIRILGATSPDGIHWQKMESPILVASDINYSPDVNEASLIKTDDGFWFIPFSTDKSIGIARSHTFSGNYEVYPKAIVSPQFDWDSEVTAPDGMVENGKMRLWFHGVREPDYWPWVIGLAEAPYPLSWE